MRSPLHPIQWDLSHARGLFCDVRTKHLHSCYVQDAACMYFVFDLFPPSLPACCIAKQTYSTQSSALPSPHMQIYLSALGKKSALGAFPTPLCALPMLPAFFFVG